MPILPSGNAGGLKRSRKREKNRPFASGKWTCVRVLGRHEKKCSHENANNILFAWRIVLEGASDASTLPMWRVE